MNWKTFTPSLAIAAALATGLSAIGASSASAASTPDEPSSAASAALEALHNRLETSATADAKQNLARFEALSPTERASLGAYLTGGIDVAPSAPVGRATLLPGGREVIQQGDARWEVTQTETRTDAGGPSAFGATYNVHSSADETFSFVGIALTRTRVWGDYVTGSGQVQRTTGNGSQVLVNYQPLTDISTWDYAPQLSGGKALFRAKITVKRGPAPGLGGNWSTKEGIQYFRASGPGVYAHGWM